jgi:hypothetical protein
MRNSPLASEDGSLLIQVVVASVVMLGVLLTGFKTVRSTIEAAGSAATSASFKDLTLLVQQSLSSTEKCGPRLGLPLGAGLPLSAIQSTTTQISISDAAGNPMVVPEPVNPVVPLPKNPYRSPEFRISSVTFQNITRKGWAAGGMPGFSGIPGSLEVERWAGEISIAAERRSEFLGSSVMNASIPIVFLVVPGAIPRAVQCTTRPVYTLDLGPPVLPPNVQRKTGIECIDRGGTPIVQPGQSWYACQFPVSSYQTCSNTVTNLPGWICTIAGTQSTPAYAY